MLKGTREANGNAEANGEEIPDTNTPGSRFRKIETESYMFNAEKCYAGIPAKDRKPLTGYLVGFQEMPPIKGREWEAAVLIATSPVMVVDREKKIIEVPAGSRVLIPATWQIKQHLQRAAFHPRFVYEVFIEPNKKIDIGGGQTMWTYNLGASEKPSLRLKFGVAALLDSPGTLSLPQGDGSEAGMIDDSTPF
jgi:hypothetical protein